MLGQARHEAVEDVVHDDHPLVGVAGLAGVADPGLPGGVGRGVDVVGVEDDVGVGPAQLEHALLEVLARDGCDDGAGPLRAGQRDTGDPRVGDDGLDLVVRGEDVDVGAVGNPRVLHQLRDGQRGAGHRLGVLEDDGVAQHQVRRREAGDLIEGVVPRHDAEQGPDRELLDDGLAARERLDRLVRSEGRALVREVVEDVSAELRLTHGLAQRLAHLAGGDRAQLVLALHEELGDPVHDLGAVLDRDVLPRVVRRMGGRQGRLDLGVGRRVEALLHLAGGRVEDLVGGGRLGLAHHAFSLLGAR